MRHIPGSSRLVLATVAAVTLLAAFAPSVSAASRPSAPAASGATRWVDNDGAAGPNGCNGSGVAFKKIQKAVNHSGPNDTVMVCPGTYRGRVVISGDRAGLTLRGVSPWSAVLVPPHAFFTAGIDSGLDLITVDHVNNVTIRGLRLSAAYEPACSLVGAMIDLEGSLNSKILGNQIFASPNPQSCGYAIGIIVDSNEPVTAGVEVAPFASALIAHNLVSNFQFWGIAAGDEDVVVTITDNSLHYYLTSPPETMDASSASVAAVGRRFSAAPSRRFSTAAQGPAGIITTEQAGIIVVGTVLALIDLNVVQSAPSADVVPVGTDNTPQLLEAGIQVAEDAAPVIVRNNLVRRVFFGVLLQAIGAKVDDNVIRKTFVGLWTGMGGGDNRVRHNTVNGLEDGIFVDNSTGDNIFRGNTAHSAGGIACEDQSTGSGTSNTGNEWVNNTGNSDSPDGICPPAAP